MIPRVGESMRLESSQLALPLSRSIYICVESSTRSIREASREDHFGEVDGHFVLRGHCRVHRVMGRFPQATVLLLAYASAAIATSPYSLPAAQLLGCPPSPACKGPRRPHWSNECSRRKRSCR